GRVRISVSNNPSISASSRSLAPSATRPKYVDGLPIAVHVGPAPSRAASPAALSAANNHDLPASFIALHGPVRFADVLEAKHAGRLGLELARRHLLGDFLQRHVGQRESRRTEHETAEEGEVDAAGHLEQRVEVL